MTGPCTLAKSMPRYQDLRDVPAQGEMEFTLWHDTAQIRSLKITSEKSSLQAQGKVTHFDNPRVEFTYSAVVDIGQLGAITRTYELRSGTLTASGSASIRAGRTSSGEAVVRGFDYLQEGVVLRNTNATADFALDNSRLALTRIAGRLLGGEVTGEATIDNLITSSSICGAGANLREGSLRPRKGRPVKPGNTQSPNSTETRISGPGPQQGRARPRVSGASLAELTPLSRPSRCPWSP